MMGIIFLLLLHNVDVIMFMFVTSLCPYGSPDEQKFLI
uniref:Uncharacterized protein n=1 Tax=Rhizophora mucronata TaxID=61149 RepID=A0A2P2P630_RHIMU